MAPQNNTNVSVGRRSNDRALAGTELSRVNIVTDSKTCLGKEFKAVLICKNRDPQLIRV